MNRTDRLLAMVLELQTHGTRRAEDLAATFEISKRTVYRDVEALCEAGVPVVAVPGLGYRLMAGYFLPSPTPAARIRSHSAARPIPTAWCISTAAGMSPPTATCARMCAIFASTA